SFMPTDEPIPEIIHGAVIRASGGWYEVDAPLAGKPHGLRLICQTRGLMKKGRQRVSQPVVVGDQVEVRTAPTHGANARGERLQEGSILKVLPRRSELGRARYGKTKQITVANLDLVIVVMSVREPDLNTHRLDRFLVLAEANDLDALICFNKVDLINKSTFKREIAPVQKSYKSLGYRCLSTSDETDEGIEELRTLLENKISVFAGSSGVGKTSLACAVQPGLHLWIGEVMDIGKGRHTTTEVTLHPLDGGGYLVDTPGIKTVMLLEEHEVNLAECFPEFRGFLGQCRFNNCSHREEPGCAMREAVEKKKITAPRYQSYLRILEEFKQRPTRYGNRE
ncbi:MAG: ribosome small subunit-dependent GTPase A, partial [Abditibacteriaceae bacterium]